MDMPGGASLSAPNSATQLPRRSSYLITIPREIRDKIYSFCNYSQPPQCRKCSAIEYDDIKYEHVSATPQPFEHAAKLGKYKTFSWPYIPHRCHVNGRDRHDHCGFVSRSTVFWINRVLGARAHHKTRHDYICRHRECASRRKNKLPLKNTQQKRDWMCGGCQNRTSQHKDAIGAGQRGWVCCRGSKDWHHHIPPLAQVNQQLRAEVLSTMFSKSQLFATVFDAEADGAAILQKMKAIGSESAGKIKKLDILYSKKKDLKYIMTSLMRDLRIAGLRTAEGVVNVVRWTQKKQVGGEYGDVAMPGCQCEFCMVQYLREKDRQARGV